MITKNYIPYKIKSEDTLKSLASRIGLEHYRLLRDFHNNVCTQTELLKTDILIKGKSLCVPDIQEIKQLNRDYKEQQESKPINKIQKLKFSQLKATYKVKINKVNSGGSNESKNEIAYDLVIDHIETTEDTSILKIEKNDFSVNDRSPQSKMQQLAMQCANAYYPMEVIINKWGRIEKINNMTEIQKRWSKNKTKIEETFTGQYVDNYLENSEYKIFNTNQLETVIKNDIVLQSLFLPYKTLTDEIETSFNLNFFNHNVTYQIVQEIENEQENELLILQEGNVDDPRSYRDLLDPEITKNNPYALPLPKIEGSLKNKFYIDIEKGILKKIDAHYIINYTPNKCKKTHINMNLINKR